MMLLYMDCFVFAFTVWCDARVRAKGMKNPDILLSDTVGFIQKLPTNLIAAFRATLEEITEADVLLVSEWRLRTAACVCLIGGPNDSLTYPL